MPLVQAYSGHCVGLLRHEAVVQLEAISVRLTSGPWGVSYGLVLDGSIPTLSERTRISCWTWHLLMQAMS